MLDTSYMSHSERPKINSPPPPSSHSDINCNIDDEILFALVMLLSQIDKTVGEPVNVVRFLIRTSSNSLSACILSVSLLPRALFASPELLKWLKFATVSSNSKKYLCVLNTRKQSMKILLVLSLLEAMPLSSLLNYP